MMAASESDLNSLKVPSLKIRLPTTAATASTSSIKQTHEIAVPFPYTFEEQIIVRFPPTIAAQLSEELQEGEGQPEDLSIIFHDARRASVTFHGRPYAAVLLDLPTIIETHKTLDRSQYYKIADISQLLLVVGAGSPLESEGDVHQRIAGYEKQGWQYPDGLTPPLRNIRSRRWQHTATSASLARQREIEAMERKVQAMLDRDTASIASSFVVLDGQGRPILRGGGVEGKLVRVREDQEGGTEEVEEAIMEESEIEEGAEEVEEAIEEEEEEETEERKSSQLPSEKEELFSKPGKMIDSMAEPSTEAPKPALSPAAMELQAKINERKAQLASVSNPLIKARLEDVIKQLEQELDSRIK